jgi:putative GTP pyrophosphokinase
MQKWVPPLYSDRRIYNSAGRVLVSNTSTEDERRQAMDTISNWRVAHRYPLHSIMMGLRQRAHAVDGKAVVVQRLKRLPSIIPKLQRGLNLTQIQDIGGCRAVIRDVARLEALCNKYVGHELASLGGKSYLNGDRKDYIREPKRDGYRGVHLVFRYVADVEKYHCYDDMKVEIQLRSQAQHSWATAVEIVDFFTGERLKTDIERNQATPQWKRFFQLMSSFMADEEGLPWVPETPTSRAELIEELREVCTSFHVINKLEGYGATVTRISTSGNLPKSGPYLIVLNVDKRTLRITPYNEEADNYLKREKEYLNNPLVQVLQADASSLSQLKRAYPNYELDTKEFVERVKKALNQ